jgi:formylglycine-generating enzyme required for sulfatase activity
MEWCQDEFSSFNRAADDTKQVLTVTNEQLRLMRGGSFVHLVRYVRTAFRYGNRPDERLRHVGFRPARTYH